MPLLVYRLHVVKIQKVISVSLLGFVVTGLLAFGGAGAVFAQVNSTTPGKCPDSNVSSTDPCVLANVKAAGLEGDAVKARNIAQECDARSNSTGSRNKTTLGSCYNAMGSCRQNIPNASDCENPGLLEMAAKDTCIGSGTCADDKFVDAWDDAVDSHNDEYGGPDIDSNKGKRGKIEADYNKNTRGLCEQKYKHDISKYDQCLKDMEAAFSSCYDTLGGYNNGQQTKVVNQTDLDSCINNNPQYRKHANPIPSDLNNQTDCEAAGFDWQQDVGVWQAGQQPTVSCKYKQGQDPCENHGGMKNDGSGECNDGTNPQSSVGSPTSPNPNNNTGDVNEGECGDARLVFFPASSIPGCSEDAGIGPIGGVLKFVMTILSVGVGIVAVGGVVYGSLLYASARDNGGQTEQAMTIIRNVVIGVLLYIFMITILNWLVPGGVIG